MKIIIFDDDPTGSQTVYGCPLILNVDEETLSYGLKHKSHLVFLLTNTRSMSESLSALKTRETCVSICKALEQQNISFKETIFISRGDSTLRGHGYLEPKVINDELGPFDATFHIPAFFEGGRTTENGIHLLNGTPVHLTPFAKDSVFKYSTSDLAEWIDEKSGGLISSESVVRLNVELLQEAEKSDLGMKKLLDLLFNLSNNMTVVVDAKVPAHLNILADCVQRLLAEKRFLFRSAASFINSLAKLKPQTYSTDYFYRLRRKNKKNVNLPGLIVVGSYVQLADKQLEALLKDKSCLGIEIPVNEIEWREEETISSIPNLTAIENKIFENVKFALAANKTPVIYTSRGERQLPNIQERVKFGNMLASSMARIISGLIPSLGYIICKGGITTNTLLASGLKLNLVELKGQILPGLSVVMARPKSINDLIPIITFPGNLGAQETLLISWKLMEGK